MRSIIKEFIIIAVLTVCGSTFSLVAGLISPPWKEAPLAAGEIHLKDIQALDVIWVDARSETDYAAGHIPNALLLNDSNWDEGVVHLMNAWLPNVRPVVVYCGSEQCSSSKRIAERLREALPEAEVYSLKGGWDAWVE